MFCVLLLQVSLPDRTGQHCSQCAALLSRWLAAIARIAREKVAQLQADAQ